MTSTLRRAGIWTFRIVAVLLILYGLNILLLSQPVRTPGNIQIWFAGDLSQSVSRDLDAAYGRLCVAEKERIPLAFFRETGGADYSVLSQGTVYGGDSEFSFDRLPDDVDDVWTELVVDRSFQGGPIEVWRLSQVRERDWWQLGGDWKICGIEQRE